MPPTQPPPLYAMYVQATRHEPSTGKTRRRQWIVFPLLTKAHAKAVGPKAQAQDEQLMFWREQAGPENRVKWRYELMEPDRVRSFMRTTLDGLTTLDVPAPDRWSISPVITAQVTPRELAALMDDPKTPYVALRRFEKVAKSKHNIAI